MKRIATPYYLIDERRLLRNLEIIRRVREESGAKSVLALKCFATWSVFGLMREYMDGTTSSGVYEARLGREKFGKEVHAYSVGFSRDDVRAVRRVADKIIFNSLSQLRAFAREARGLKIGVRVNPGFSHSHYDLADPAPGDIDHLCHVGLSGPRTANPRIKSEQDGDDSLRSLVICHWSFVICFWTSDQ